MNLLLDTHTFYWWSFEPTKLSDVARDAIADPANAVYLSVASPWEIVIKSEIGRLQLRQPIDVVVATHVATSGFRVLPVELRHVYSLRGLPLHHKDPFDRLLMAQSIADTLTIVTKDAVFAQYPVTTLW